MVEMYKSIRDPIYGFITATKEEINLMDTRFVQRLRRIKQLGSTHLLYPSACHTRFEHSLGTMHMASRMANQLKLKDGQEELIRYAALLHDIGHGPLSHSFEDAIQYVNESKIAHEDITKKIILGDKEIFDVIGDKRVAIANLFDYSKGKCVEKDILSSNIDADRIDYLIRDSHHIGVAYGMFDVERLLLSLDTHREGSSTHLVINEKGQQVIDSFRLARYLMHTQVYKHKLRRICDSMFSRGVYLAIKDGTVNKRMLDINDSHFLDNYYAFDDVYIFNQILSKDGDGYSIINALNNRKIFKVGYSVDLKTFSNPYFRLILSELNCEKRKIIEETLADKCRCNSNDIVISIDEIDNSMFASSNEILESGKIPISIKMKNGDVVPLDTVSPFYTKESKPMKIFSIICPREHVDTIGKESRGVILDLQE